MFIVKSFKKRLFILTEFFQMIAVGAINYITILDNDLIWFTLPNDMYENFVE